jgi:hypothetical protein
MHSQNNTTERLGAVDLWTMRLAPHRRACGGQRFALPTAPTFAHKLHRAPPPLDEQSENGKTSIQGDVRLPKARPRYQRPG